MGIFNRARPQGIKPAGFQFADQTSPPPVWQPPAPPSEQDIAVQRLRDIEGYWNQYPGAAPGGTGATGLASSDAQGWSNLQRMQTEHMRLKNQLSDRPKSIEVQGGGSMGGMPESIAANPYSSFNLNPYAPGNVPNIANATAEAQNPSPTAQATQRRSAALSGLRSARPFGLG